MRFGQQRSQICVAAIPKPPFGFQAQKEQAVRAQSFWCAGRNRGSTIRTARTSDHRYEYRRKNRITLPKLVGICFIDSISQQRNEMPNFLIDLLRVINGPSNLLAEEF